MSNAAGYQVRRVGFRSGTDDELKALHAVEVPIETERGSNRMPRSIGAYMASARSLPSQFSDHSWIAETTSGTAIASAYCWFNAAGDPRVMECDVLVQRDRRRQGLGTQLMAQICEETAREGRSLLTWSTFDAIPAGESFSRSIGGEIARVNRKSELVLIHVDWRTVQHWASGERPRELGYSLDIIVGPFPDQLRADAAKFHHIMQTAPRDDLDVGDVTIGVDFVTELDKALADSSRIRWTLLVRDRVGACVGGTEVTFELDDRSIAFQQNTGIDPAHRALGLAKWVKAAMLERIRRDRPETQRVRTANAFSNAPMLAINDALGFKIVSTRTEWQAGVNNIVRSLG